MKVRFWGTRGSIATPGAATARYGGNTACTEVRADDGTLLILDCGSGARELGLALQSAGPVKAHILISHTHLDHIQGFPFFSPAFLPDSEITVYAPPGFSQTLESALSQQMQYSYFPLRLEELRSRLKFVDVEEGLFQVGGVRIETQYLNHTSPALGYRLTAGGATLVYSTDHEPFTSPSGSLIHPGDQRHTAFLERAQLVIHDAQYTEDEYRTKLGWGHSPMSYAVDVAMEAGAKRLALYHHDPVHDDATVKRIESAAQAHAVTRRSALDVFAAAERMEISLSEWAEEAPRLSSRSALEHRPIAGARVLLAGKDPGHVGALTNILSQEGIEVLPVEDERVVLATARAYQPHAVVLDGTMLGDRIFSLTGSLSAEFSATGTALILLFPSLGEETIRRAHGAGATDCLLVPFSPPMLYARLRAWLSRHYERRNRQLPVQIDTAQPAAAKPGTGRALSLRTSVLASAELFGALPEEELAFLASRSTLRTFNPAQDIVQQGKGGGAVYVLVSGRVRVVGRPPETYAGEVLLDELGPGEVFGELSSLDDLPPSATVRAVAKTRCLVIRQTDLLLAMERNAPLALRLLRTLAQRLRQSDRMLARGGPDALTGLPTYQSVDEHYKREASATRRRGSYMASLLLDVDDLNGINDAHGNIVGDEVLQAVAGALRAATRDSDIVARLGGDNFLAILPDTDDRGASLVASRATQLIQDLVTQETLPAGLRCSIRTLASRTPPATLQEWLFLMKQKDERRQWQAVG